MTEKDRIIHTLRTWSPEHWQVIAGTQKRFIIDRLIWKAAAFLGATKTEAQAAAIVDLLDYQDLLQDAVIWYKTVHKTA